MKQLHKVPKQRILTAALLLALANPVAAQVAATDTTDATTTTTDAAAAEAARKAEAAKTEAATLDAVVVTGIRGSLKSSMDLKRESQGVVDGIVAEDIGKFPDTNLAESLQRISGVSIDRRGGEGSKVTVRGVGPEFNLVLFNGRQMPTSNLEETSASNSRAFDFANLASEAISEINVYKTSRASNPTGGIGATINIMTARPLENPGFHASAGAKGVFDESNDRLPDSLQGSSVTPEVSGFFSNTSADGRFGIAISGSYQERDLGYNQAAVANGWRTCTRVADYADTNPDGTWCWGQADMGTGPGTVQAGDIYSSPQNVIYSVNGVQRQRTNGLVTLQFAPTDNLTATLDYVYSENKVQTQRNESSVWFTACCGDGGPKTYSPGPISAPIIFTQNLLGGYADIAMAGANYATKTENNSLGFNLDWRVSDVFGLQLDAHKSTAESGADSPYGSNAVLGTATFTRGTTVADFSQDFPVVSIELPNGATALDPSTMLVTGSSFRNGYQKAEIEQAQLTGHYDFFEDSRLDFGIGMTDYDNRSAFSSVENGSWGGAQNQPDLDGVFHLDEIRPYFGSIDGSDNPALFNQFFTWDFEQVRALAAAANGDPSRFLRSDVFTDDRRTKEESQSAFLQYSTIFDTAMPVNLAIGVRYEKTDVTSSALVPNVTAITSVSTNEFVLTRGAPTVTTLEGSYQYVLPNFDMSVDLSDDKKLRLSYGESIGRPGWGDIQGGQTLGGYRIGGGTGSQGNPGLKPLLSHNFDLSFEWYYGESSYAAMGYFRKNIDNYIGTSTFLASPFDLRTPVGGTFWNAAISAGGCGIVDTICIRNYIFDNYDGQGGVTNTGVDSNGNRTGTITGQPGDPLAVFSISAPSNQRSASVDGWEFNIQHLFGDSGFGVFANYTIVDSNLEYDNAKLGPQFALEGLSDSANVVGFYEKDKWSLRLAYNWRDEFLAARSDGAGGEGQANPMYTEPYGQLDLNVTYLWNENLSFSFEGINLNDGIQRLHGRTETMVNYVTQTGPRYMFGVRYKFGGAPAPIAAPVRAPAPQVTCSDLDDDRDGVNNCADKCYDSLAGQAVGMDGCPVPAPAPEPVVEPKAFRG